VLVGWGLTVQATPPLALSRPHPPLSGSPPSPPTDGEVGRRALVGPAVVMLADS
jgi:hypothetical protein